MLSFLVLSALPFDGNLTPQPVSQDRVKQIITCFRVKETLTEVISAMFCINDEVYNREFLSNLQSRRSKYEVRHIFMCRTNSVVNTVLDGL